MIKKVLMWGSVAFMVFMIAYRPHSIAAVYESIGKALGLFIRPLF